jgi:drug/metabolite transporter (DMT)-like permease
MEVEIAKQDIENHTKGKTMSIENGSTEPTMDASGNSNKGRLMAFLIALNIILSALGNTGGPLMSRLYFHKGGKREWLSAFLETAGFPILLIPMYLSYLSRRRHNPAARFFLSTQRLFLACVVLGILTGVDDYLYAYGLSFLPASTSALLISTQLGFTAFFAFLMVKQRFTSFSLNSIALLTVGAVILGLHASSDRPSGESNADYYKGFLLTLGCAALYGLILPLIELTYKKVNQDITYSLVVEMQLIMGAFATLFCAIGMIFAKDFQVLNVHTITINSCVSYSFQFDASLINFLKF